MLDVDAQRLNPADGPAYRAGGGQPTDPRRPLVIAGAFAAAIGLGVAIGLATAPTKTPAPRPAPTVAPPAEVQPPLEPSAWEGSRQPGAAHQMRVRPVDRRAFSASLAYALREGGTAGVATDDVVIPQGKLFYGAVEGVDSAADEYWAVGLAQVAGVTPAPPNPQVWKRAGNGPWQRIAQGPGACDGLPTGLFTVWQGRPPLCSGG
ncbi:hypothetical protein [Protofrankia sp. BMG5.30]|uniref:hypothetical protein n=1 Tax=Protofrankia sp. BMG5.30 TaxID=1834514 RepID=UPI000976729D|nr:hypothetical protein [Protofrankia sp. BMG5.30]ONH36101.1 hypothetical protein BL254_08020 [Protofrankia sp. BMG5.30]